MEVEKGERRGCVAGGKDRETERKTRSCRERTRRFECSSREVQLASMDLPDRWNTRGRAHLSAKCTSETVENAVRSALVFGISRTATVSRLRKLSQRCRR